MNGINAGTDSVKLLSQTMVKTIIGVIQFLEGGIVQRKWLRYIQRIVM